MMRLIKEPGLWVIYVLVLFFAFAVAQDPVEFVLSVQKMEIDGLLLLTGAVIGFSRRQRWDSYFYMLGALWPAYGIAISLMVLKSVDVPSEGFANKFFIFYLGLSLFFTFFTVMVAFCGYQSLSKESSVVKSPASKIAEVKNANISSDLARDLRLSRSRTRRSRVKP
ncbi:hypothetical protein [Kushneria phyllosphaerae]|uniref:hypothetical protein n=1 Tax=Kushneria phyllosphaerae TaxID=2100822 RepID=UPI001057B5CF|nr:hypothetical protein [Kushneria phyllosphaerae]